MKALAISYKGMEDITSLEISELLKVETEEKESCVVFDGEYEDLALLSYKGQAVNRVLILLDSFKINKISDLKRISKIDFSKWIKRKKFAARSEIIENKFRTAEIERTTGDYVEGKVNLDKPDIVVFVYIYKKDCYVGIDFSGNISKRDYKIFSTKNDIKGTIGYAFVRLSGYSREKSFLNLNSKTGTIAIEAALFGSGLSVNYFNKKKFPFLKFFKIDLDKFDKKPKPIKVFASDAHSYLRVVDKNSKVAGIKIKLKKIEADCVVRYDNRTVEIKNLKKKREINKGKEVIKIARFLKS